MVAANPKFSAVAVPTTARSVDVIPTERASVMTTRNESMAVVAAVALVVAVVVVVVVRKVAISPRKRRTPFIEDK
jgi:chorismate synthase